MCGTCKDLLNLFVLLSLLLRTVSNVTARIPLPTRFSSLRSGGPPSPREKVHRALPRQSRHRKRNANL